jgi:hypothetical protein
MVRGLNVYVPPTYKILRSEVAVQTAEVSMKRVAWQTGAGMFSPHPLHRITKSRGAEVPLQAE